MGPPFHQAPEFANNIPGGMPLPAQLGKSLRQVLLVPLSYADPEGRSISLMIDRLPAGTPGPHPILLTNPAGPGGQGLPTPGQLRGELPAAVLNTYDIIGFDPRFIGRSTPITCGQPAEDLGGIWMRWPHPGSFPWDVARRATAPRRARLTRAGRSRTPQPPIPPATWTSSAASSAPHGCPSSASPTAGIWAPCTPRCSRGGRAGSCWTARSTQTMSGTGSGWSGPPPYAGSQLIHADIAGSRLITLHASVHVPYPGYGDACVNDAVNSYLETGQLPPADLMCA